MLLEELVLPLRTDNALFKAGLAAAAAGVAALVAGMGLAIKATFKWADDMDSLGDVIGGTNKELAALNFIARKSGVSIDTFAKGNVIMEKGLLKANGTLDTVGKKLKEFGINVKDANGIVKDQVMLTDEIAQKYGTLATAQERVNFLTEIYGRSGAELIDFFDTLAAEGGIDTVAAKVERLGLAIDPNRYEQFNRNLEELKLIGLSLAVGFTEKVMPVLEKFLEFISDPKGIDISKIAAWADNAIAKFVKGLGDSINDWVSGGGPEALSESLISWIEGIGDESRVKSKLEIAMGHLVTALGNAIREMDWTGIWAALDEKLEELAFKAGETLKPALSSALEAGTKQAMNSMKSALSVGTTEAMISLDAALRAGSIQAMNSMIAALQAGVTQAGNALVAALQVTKTAIQQVLDQIAQVFYQKSQSFINQAVQGFNASKGRLLSAVAELVNAINTILKKIMTTFTINVLLGSVLGGASGSASGLGSSAPKNTTNTPHPGGGGRASGGPVIGGISYNVAEFFRPEVFTPNTSGRVDPMGGTTVVALRREDINEFATVLARILPAELQKVRG